MSTPIGIIDLDALPPIDEKELLDMVKRGLAGLADEDQTEIMEIAGDLFTDEESRAMLEMEGHGRKWRV